MYSLVTSIARQLVVLLPVTYLLSLTGKLDLVWFAFPIAELITLICSYIFERITIGAIKKQIEQPTKHREKHLKDVTDQTS